jgi:hypothetical protein
MINRLSLAAALTFYCAAGLGCQSVMNCGDDCGRGCSMAFQKYDCSCDGVCGPCCGGDACGCENNCDSGCAECDPPVRRCLNRLLGCSGCGECYWSEWHNDPPSVCEPCNRCGQYIGPGHVGYYQAPYRRHEGMIAKGPSNLPPLELAERVEDPAGDDSMME